MCHYCDRCVCFVPYAELPKVQKAKDAIYVAVVQAVLSAFR